MMRLVPQQQERTQKKMQPVHLLQEKALRMMLLLQVAREKRLLKPERMLRKLERLHPKPEKLLVLPEKELQRMPELLLLLKMKLKRRLIRLLTVLPKQRFTCKKLNLNQVVLMVFFGGSTANYSNK